MTDNLIDKNHVLITGKMDGEFILGHEISGKRVYKNYIHIERLSGTSDVIPILVPDHLVNVSEAFTGKNIIINGQFHSHNYCEDNKNKVELSVYAHEFGTVNAIPQTMQNNYIHLDGSICKEPVYRRTPLGREITELFLAVNRNSGRSDYIPCICWERCAYYASGLSVGDRCAITGRIQSREYTKKLSEEQSISKIAYEVSVNIMSFII